MTNKKNIVLFSLVTVLGSILMLGGGCSSSSAHPGITIADAKGKENIVPVVILGSGPAGLSAAVYVVRGGVRGVVMQGPLPGGLLTQTSVVENWPGSKAIQGPDIIKGLEAQVAELNNHVKDDMGKVVVLSDTATAIDLNQWPYRIATENGSTIYALSIIVATGATPKMLGVPGEQEFWKNGVTTCAVCDGPFYKDQDVVVVGGGDSAAEEAMQLARHAKNVTLLVRKESMRASSSMQEHLKEFPSVKIMYNVQVKKIVGKNDELTGVELYNSSTKETSLFPTNGVFLAIGHTPNSAVVKSHVTVDDEGYITLRNRSQATNVPGVFAAGDVSDRVYRQAGVAAGHGIQAALDALAFLTAIGYNMKAAQELRGHFFVPKQ